MNGSLSVQTASAYSRKDMDSKDGGNHSELLQSLENVVMDLNDMENMIENFEDDSAETFFTKV